MTTVVAQGSLCWRARHAPATAIPHLLSQSHTDSLFPVKGKYAKTGSKGCLSTSCAESNGSCMLNRPRLYQANNCLQENAKTWSALKHLALRLIHPRSLFPFLSPYLTSRSSIDKSKLCIWNHQNQSSAVFVSLSTFSLAETNKGSPNPLANVLLLDD